LSRLRTVQSKLALTLAPLDELRLSREAAATAKIYERYSLRLS
jgi:hypothetical protein